MPASTVTAAASVQLKVMSFRVMVGFVALNVELSDVVNVVALPPIPPWMVYEWAEALSLVLNAERASE